jgi:L-ascorbate metabolism protein UlaG (beta-lactamase superfamily)
MKITKFGHCCLLLEISEKRILVDPGRFSEGQNNLSNIDIILITHEHADHCHSDSVAKILNNNPQAVVVTNTSVAKLLESINAKTQIVEGRDVVQISNLALKAYDGEHAEIVGEFGIVQNTGYLVAETFFFPGDSYTVPEEKVNILALPVAGPWCKVSEAITYAKKVSPKIAFPVHDATLNENGKAVTYPHFARELGSADIEFIILEIDTPRMF